MQFEVYTVQYYHLYGFHCHTSIQNFRWETQQTSFPCKQSEVMSQRHPQNSRDEESSQLKKKRIFEAYRWQKNHLQLSLRTELYKAVHSHETSTREQLLVCHSPPVKSLKIKSLVYFYVVKISKVFWKSCWILCLIFYHHHHSKMTRGKNVVTSEIHEFVKK